MSFESPVVSRLSLAPAGSPLRKKSVLALANQESPTTALNDDDAERRERRRKFLAPQTTSTPDPQGGKNDDARRKSMGLGTVSGLSAAQLAEHYANCIKLSTENKITVKNAFNLQLIDYMTYMLQKHDKQMEDFQVASCTLDASTKIYSYRVDAVHSDVLQMASGLGRADTNKRKTGQNDEAPEGDQDGEAEGHDSDTERRTRVQKKKRKNKAVIAAKKETLLRKQKDFRSLDTFITRLSASLATSQGGDCPFLRSIKNGEDQTGEDSGEAVLDSQLLPDLNDAEICPAFADFSLKGWKPEDDPSPPEASPTAPVTPAFENAELAFDMNKTPEPIPDYDPGDDHHFDDDDHDNHDVEMNDMYAAPEMSVRAQARVARQRANVVNLQDHLSTVPLEYSYFQSSMLSLWAGPNHWKIKPVKKGVEMDEKCAREKKKRQRKLLVLNYDDVKDFKQGASGATELTRKTLAGWNKDKHLLPQNLFTTPMSFMTLFTRPTVRVAIRNEFDAPEVDEAVPDYEYDNPADKSDFCPNVPTDDDQDDNGDIGADMDLGSQDDEDVNMDIPMECGPQTEDQGAFTGDNLIEAPNKVARSYIPYQMRAKKVDMKKLKGAIWEVLTESADCNKENISNVQEDMLNESRKLEKASTFSEVYRKVPLLLPPKMAENISCGLAFVALLHLANEKCLQVDGVPDMTDLNIRQA